MLNSSINDDLSDKVLYKNYCGMRIVYTTAAALVTLLTILGNSFVLIAVRVNHKLRRIRASILIASLAVADLLVGAIVMPLAVVQLWNNGNWELGHALCQIWTSLDVIACTASISTLCVISADRYVGVAKPLEYSYIMTRKKLWISVGFVWLFSVLVLLATVSWSDSNYSTNVNYNSTTNEEDSKRCHVGEQLDYVIYSVVLSFFIPLLIILAFYYQVYRVAQKRKKNFVQTRRGVFKWKRSTIRMRSTVRLHVKQSTASMTSTNTCFTDYTNLRTDTKKNNKAAITLGLVVGAFLLCWLPFFVLYVICK